MALRKPDIYEHNNPDRAIADSDFIRGGIRSAVTNVTDLYALGNKADQLKENSTQIFVTSQNKFYLLKSIANIGNSNGWQEVNFDGGSANLNFTYVNSATTVAKNTRVGADTSINSFTITLPTSNLNVGDVIEIIDLNKTFHLRNLIINSTPNTIEGSSAGLTCNVQGANFNLIWVGGIIGWKINIIDNNFSKAGVLTDSNVLPLLYLNIQENNNAELFDSNDVSNYKIPWNNIEYINNEYVSVSSIIDNSKYITYNPITKNLYIKEPGIYNVDLRYSSYNLRDASDFLRARLRSWDTEIPGGLTQESPILDVGLDANNNVLPYSAQRPRVLSAFAQGPIGTTFNGEAMCAGFTTFKIAIPQYVTADFLHVGALRVIPGQTDQPWGFPVYLGPYGNLPFMFISKIV